MRSGFVVAETVRGILIEVSKEGSFRRGLEEAVRGRLTEERKARKGLSRKRTEEDILIGRDKLDVVVVTPDGFATTVRLEMEPERVIDRRHTSIFVVDKVDGSTRKSFVLLMHKFAFGVD